MMSLHLDHIIILVPYGWLSNPPAWITSNFTITPGGQHADGKTENFLVIFEDGVYLEFIAFINDDPAHRKGHWWGEKKVGIVDFAFTSASLDAPTLFSQLEDRLTRLELGEEAPKVQYQAPVAGGRVRPDGQKIGWNVTFPIVNTGYQRGELPFFCQDLTPRQLRAPITETNTTHPNGTYGVDEFYVFIPAERANALARAYSAVLNVENSVSDNDQTFSGTFEFKRLFEVDGADVEDGPVIVVGAPFEEEQQHKLEESGGLLLANLTLGGVDGRVLKKIDLGNDSIGGVFAPAL